MFRVLRLFIGSVMACSVTASAAALVSAAVKSVDYKALTVTIEKAVGCGEVTTLTFNDQTLFEREKQVVDSSVLVAAETIVFDCPAAGGLVNRVVVTKISSAAHRPDAFLTHDLGNVPLKGVIDAIHGHDKENPFRDLQGDPDFEEGLPRYKLRAPAASMPDLTFSTGKCRIRPDERAVACEYFYSEALVNVLAACVLVELGDAVKPRLASGPEQVFDISGRRLAVRVDYGKPTITLRVEVRQD
jgi:hypothetical protein